jgi:hypothetical protein
MPGTATSRPCASAHHACNQFCYNRGDAVCREKGTPDEDLSDRCWLAEKRQLLRNLCKVETSSAEIEAQQSDCAVQRLELLWNIQDAASSGNRSWTESLGVFELLCGLDSKAAKVGCRWRQVIEASLKHTDDTLSRLVCFLQDRQSADSTLRCVL